jgi:predicted small metal-binding protein
MWRKVMMKLECKDLGTNCSYVAQGNTLDEVKKKAMEHTQAVHPDFLAKMSPQQMADLDKTLTRLTH